MDIPVDVPAECTDGPCGRSAYVILQPGTERVTHLAIDEGGLGGRRLLVPIELISESTPALVRLRCSGEELRALPPADQQPSVPVGLAIGCAARVRALDGEVGQVDEFLVDPVEQQITHLVLRQGHLWGQRAVTIPASAIDHLEDDIVYLKLDRRGIEQLPGSPTRH